MKNIKVSRSYSAKIQLKQYEPIESFCAAEAEVEEAEMELASASLDKFVRDEVSKTLRGIPLSDPTLEEIAHSEEKDAPIPKFDYTNRKDLTEDQYQGFGKDEKGFGYPRKKGEKKIDLRGEPVCRSCGGTSSNLNPIVANYHPECRKRESFKAKDL